MDEAFTIDLQTSWDNMSSTVFDNGSTVTIDTLLLQDSSGEPDEDLPVGESGALCLFTDEVYYIGATTIASFGVVFNCLFIFVICKVPAMRTLPNAYLLNLAVADLLLLVSVLLNFSLELTLLTKLLYSKAFQYYILIFHSSLLFTSLINVTVISAERFVGISYPLRFRQSLSKSRIKRVILLTWLLGVVLSVPRIIQAAATDKAVTDKARNVAYILYVIVFTVTLLIVVVMYLLTAKNYRAFCRQMEAFEHTNRKSDEKQISITCGVISLVFFVSLLPSIYKFIHQYIWVNTGQNTGGTFAVCMYDFSRWLLVINSSVNPVLYNLINQTGRNAFLHVVSCRPLPDKSSTSPARTIGTTVSAKTGLQTYV